MKASHPHPSRPMARIEVHVEVIDQLFNSIDPSPFHSRDLDADAEEYVVESAKEMPKGQRFELIIHLDKPPAHGEKIHQVGAAIRTYFAARAVSQRLLLKDLFQRGRTSLLIGLVFLSLSLVFSEFSKAWFGAGQLTRILSESVLIGGWVAMWRPMEIFLYDWWPITAKIRLLDRLAQMPVRVLIKHGRSDASGPDSRWDTALDPVRVASL